MFRRAILAAAITGGVLGASKPGICPNDLKRLRKPVPARLAGVLTEGVSGSRVKVGAWLVAEDRDRAFDGGSEVGNPLQERTQIARCRCCRWTCA